MNISQMGIIVSVICLDDANADIPYDTSGEHVNAHQNDMYANKCIFKINLKLFSHHLTYEYWWKGNAQNNLRPHHVDSYTCRHIHRLSCEKKCLKIVQVLGHISQLRNWHYTVGYYKVSF